MKLLMWLPGVDVSQGLPHDLTVGPGDSCKYGTDKPREGQGVWVFELEYGWGVMPIAATLASEHLREGGLARLRQEH